MMLYLHLLFKIKIFLDLLAYATGNHPKYHLIFPILRDSGINKGTVRVFSLSVRCTNKINAYVFG